MIFPCGPQVSLTSPRPPTKCGSVPSQSVPLERCPAVQQKQEKQEIISQEWQSSPSGVCLGVTCSATVPQCLKPLQYTPAQAREVLAQHNSFGVFTEGAEEEGNLTPPTTSGVHGAIEVSYPLATLQPINQLLSRPVNQPTRDCQSNRLSCQTKNFQSTTKPASK